MGFSGRDSDYKGGGIGDRRPESGGGGGGSGGGSGGTPFGPGKDYSSDPGSGDIGYSSGRGSHF